ncbi:MAG: YabP/YqfC family sporulation protein [Lachnospiraceae bacterium]|nr:YabP/YqfC family sporulation protein [Lachnospiraceae bacterium]
MKNQTFNWLPEDLDFGQPYFFLKGSRSIYLQNVKKICAYAEDCIRLRGGNETVCIAGKGLKIAFYQGDEMLIEGSIRSVTLGSAGVGEGTSGR